MNENLHILAAEAILFESRAGTSKGVQMDFDIHQFNVLKQVEKRALARIKARGDESGWGDFTRAEGRFDVLFSKIQPLSGIEVQLTSRDIETIHWMFCLGSNSLDVLLGREKPGPIQRTLIDIIGVFTQNGGDMPNDVSEFWRTLEELFEKNYK